MIPAELRRKVFQNRVEIDQFRSHLLLQASQLRPQDPNLPTYALDVQLYEAAVSSVHNAVANFEASIWQSNPDIYSAHLALKEEERAAAYGPVQQSFVPLQASQSFTAPAPVPLKPVLFSDHRSPSSTPDVYHLRELDQVPVAAALYPQECLPDALPEPVTPQADENTADDSNASSALPEGAVPATPDPRSPASSEANSVASGELARTASILQPATPAAVPPKSSQPTTPPAAQAETPLTPPATQVETPLTPPAAAAAAAGPSTPPAATPQPTAPITITTPSPTAAAAVTPQHPNTPLGTTPPPTAAPIPFAAQATPGQAAAIQQAAAALAMQPSALQAWLQNFESIARALPALNLNSQQDIPSLQQSVQQLAAQLAPPPYATPSPAAAASPAMYSVPAAAMPPAQQATQAQPIARETSFSSTATQLSYAPSSSVTHSYAVGGGVARTAPGGTAPHSYSLGGSLSRTSLQQFTPLGGIAEHAITDHSAGALQLAQSNLENMLSGVTQRTVHAQQAQQTNLAMYQQPTGYNLPRSPVQYTPPSPSITSSMITNHPVPSTTSDSPLARLIAEAAGMADASGAGIKQAVHQSVNTDKEQVSAPQTMGESKGEQLYKQLDAQTLCELAQLMLSTQEVESVSSVPSGLTSQGSRVPSSVSTVANSTVAKYTASYPASSTSSGDKHSTSTSASDKQRKKKKESKLARAYKSAMKETFANEKAPDNSRLWMNWA